MAVSKSVRRRAVAKTSTSIFLLFGVFNVLYFINWIPPVPMALKHVGVYHAVTRATDDYQYSLTFEEPQGWDRYIRQTNKVFNWSPGDTAFCFASVFSSTAMNKKIFHLWEYDDPDDGWILIEKLGYDLFGGRDGGFRGYSFKTSVKPGDWRVEIVTEDDIKLGSVDFVVVRSDASATRKFKSINR